MPNFNLVNHVTRQMARDDRIIDRTLNDNQFVNTYDASQQEQVRRFNDATAGMYVSSPNVMDNPSSYLLPSTYANSRNVMSSAMQGVFDPTTTDNKPAERESFIIPSRVTSGVIEDKFVNPLHARNVSGPIGELFPGSLRYIDRSTAINIIIVIAIAIVFIYAYWNQRKMDYMMSVVGKNYSAPVQTGGGHPYPSGNIF